MEFTLIPDLVPQNRHAVIKVYVSRKWIFRGAMDNGPIHHIDLVLIDKEVKKQRHRPVILEFLVITLILFFASIL
jgi:hypothetical protein